MLCHSLHLCHLQLIDLDECCCLIRIHAAQMTVLVYSTGWCFIRPDSTWCTKKRNIEHLGIILLLHPWLLWLKWSASGWRIHPQRPSVRQHEEESDLEFGGVCHSCGGSGTVLGLSGRSTLCLLQTGGADIQEQGTHIPQSFLSLLVSSSFAKRLSAFNFPKHYHLFFFLWCSSTVWNPLIL